MKIWLVTMQFGPGYSQGTERYVGDLGEALTDAGHEVTYVAGDPLGRFGETKPGHDRTTDPPIVALPATDRLATRGRWDNHLQERLMRDKPDVVHVANPAHVGVRIMEAAIDLGIAVVVTAMDYWWVCPKSTLLRGNEACDGTPGWTTCIRCVERHESGGLSQEWAHGGLGGAMALAGVYARRGFRHGLDAGDVFRWFRRRSYLTNLLQSIDAMIFPSRAMADILLSQIHPKTDRRIPYGLSPAWLQQPRRDKNINFESATVGYAGALSPHKGVHLLLDAFAKLGWPGARLRLAGPRDEAGGDEYAKSLICAGSLDVEFCGALPPDRMPEFIRSLDVLVVPSLWRENTPFVLLEAQALGVPVIASDVTGVAEAVGPGGYTFQSGNVAALADTLKQWRREKRMPNVGPVRSAAEMASETVALYEQVLRGKPPK
jgi:glycosyltransferase involved in cell wall biosynthesis